MFELHTRLAEDCFFVGDFSLSRLLLMNDCHYPWFILVPRVADVTEIYQLSASDQAQLAVESAALSETLASLFKADKMNVAALGNVVSQLHIHHIVRYRNDATWPDPVWGKKAALAYDKVKKSELTARFESVFAIEFIHAKKRA